MKLKTGKDEIVYLLQKVMEKYEETTGQEIVRNTNRKNYEDLARKLSEISNELPYTADELGHNNYTPAHNPKELGYPNRKYDITAGQIKDAYFGIVTNPRPFLVDACYIYLYGVGRKGFEKEPKDPNLVEYAEQGQSSEIILLKEEQAALKSKISRYQQEKKEIADSLKKAFKKEKAVLIFGLVIVFTAFILVLFKWISTKNRWETIKKDMNILPYQPTQAEIDSLEGIWICYTGSPQTRISDRSRYHMIVTNVVEITYKNGYFTFMRYGPNFDQTGYMQYDSRSLVSIHTYVKNSKDSVESPRHSLMSLNSKNPLVSVISSSWSFDFGSSNQIIGIREVYVKQGKGGSMEEVINTTENASCKCKIIRWNQSDKDVTTFYLKNELLDTLPDKRLIRLLDEKSIILREPNEKVILTKDTANTQAQ